MTRPGRTLENGSHAPNVQMMYSPRSIAVVGAHEERGGLGLMTKKAIERATDVGASFYPVNPTKEKIFDYRCYNRLADIGSPVDVALILTGDPISILEEAATGGVQVGFVFVFANGFSELGTAEGNEREKRLLAASRAVGARLLGPNTNGNAWEKLVDRPGPKIALVSQSGVQGRPLTQAQDLGVALSYWAPTGNEADLGVADFIESFAQDESTAVICTYIEGFRSGQRLREAVCTAIEHEKPIVMVKVGRSDEGNRMAQSHTGHLAGSDEIFEAFVQQFGINRVDDLDEWVEVAVGLSRCKVPPADGVVVCSVSGGTAAHLGDLVADAGLSMPPLSAETQKALHEIIPKDFSVRNPVDNGGGIMRTGAGPRIWELCLRDPQVGLMMCPIPAASPGLTEAVGESLIEVWTSTNKAILPIWSGPSTDHPTYRQLWENGLPVFRNFRNAIAAAHALLRHPSRGPELKEMARLARALPPLRESPQANKTLEEDQATVWLESKGIPFAAHRTAETAIESALLAKEIGFPVVLKGRGSLHKTELGQVVLGLDNPDAVEKAGERLLEEGADGLLIAHQESGGIELLLGVATDAQLGPVILVGAGGTTAEAVGDVKRAVLPLTRAQGERMLSQLKISPLLRGWRGADPVDESAIVDAMMLVADLAVKEGIFELDINPLLARSDGVIGLDAMVSFVTDES